MKRNQTGGASKFIGNIDRMRPFLRYIAYGCYNKELIVRRLGISSSSYDTYISRLSFWLTEERLLPRQRGHYRYYTLAGDSYRGAGDISRLFRAKTVTASSVFHIFSLLQCIYREGAPLTMTELLGYRLAPTDSPYPSRIAEDGKDAALSPSTVKRYLTDLKRQGLLEEIRESRSFGYAPVKNPLAGLLPGEVRELMFAVALYQGLAPVSLPGYFLEETLREMYALPLEKAPLQLKHVSAARLLDDGVRLAILTAIREKKLLSFTYGGTRREALPVSLLINACTGRHYLLALEKKQRGRQGYELSQRYRLEELSALKVQGKKWKEHKKYSPKKAQALRLRLHFEGEAEGASLRAGLAARLEGIEFSEDGREARVSLQDTREVFPYLRTLGATAEILEETSEHLRRRMRDDIEEALKKYGEL